MKDRTLDVFLMVLLGLGGAVILVLVWTQPMSLADRVLSTSIGSIGMVWGLGRAMFSKPIPVRTGVERAEGHETVREGMEGWPVRGAKL